jgi:hypothetical protein
MQKKSFSAHCVNSILEKEFLDIKINSALLDETFKDFQKILRF